MIFTIVTPAFRVPRQLPACVESVRAQFEAAVPESDEPSVEHLIQMGGNPDKDELSRLSQFLVGGKNYTSELHVETDTGMYDALNLGFSKAKGDILGHLNADEQYLPGTLREVSRLFSAHPEIDAVVGAVVVVNPGGEYICSRFPIVPTLREVRCLPLSIFTAATFFRKSSLDKLESLYDATYKASGDADFVEKLIGHNFRFLTTRTYFSVFEDNGENLALSLLAKEDKQRRRARLSFFEQKLVVLTRIQFRVRKLFAGGYRAPPFSYSYIGENLERETKNVQHPKMTWKR